MHFLGNVGIDPKLLIAQILNFALLVWLLSYFVYKPFIASVEKNEKELLEGRLQKKAVEEEKHSFARQKEKELASARALGKKIVEEAKIMTETMRRESSETAKKESARLVEQTKEALTSQKPTMVREITKDAMVKFSDGFRQSFGQFVDLRYQAEFQDVIFKSFLDQIVAAPVEELKESDRAELTKLRKVSSGEFNKKLLEKIGPISLEYAVALPASQRKKAEKLIAKKIGVAVPVPATQNKRLINGFRLEIRGRVVESTISRILEHAETI